MPGSTTQLKGQRIVINSRFPGMGDRLECYIFASSVHFLVQLLGKMRMGKRRM